MASKVQLEFINPTSDEKVYLFDKVSNQIREVEPNEALNLLYYQECRMPTQKEIESSTVQVRKFYKESSIEEVKRRISTTNTHIPLFNIYHNNIYLIKAKNVFLRVMFEEYKFPDNHILDFIKKDKEVLKKKGEDRIIERKLRKYKLIEDFLNQLDMDALYDSYVKIFFRYSEHNNYTITCIRPSFIPYYKHLKPYYTRVELKKLARNMGLSQDEENVQKQGDENLDRICQLVSENDISSLILQSHQEFIIRTDKVGLFKYYTFTGSYHINRYLRNPSKEQSKNSYLEQNIIAPIWKAVLEAPEFDKEYCVYRFISDDNFLQELKIGSIFQDGGFTSATRDPFYKSDVYQFGFILIKIRLPGKKKGVALSLELVSQFPKEEELILAPLTKLKLISRDFDVPYYHIEQNYTYLIKTRYEFEYVEPGELLFDKSRNEEEFQTIDFLKLSLLEEKKNYNKVVYSDSDLSLINQNNFASFFTKPTAKLKTCNERINYFQTQVLKKSNCFSVGIQKKKFVLFVENFNSLGAYEEFYSIKTSKGFGIYCIENGYTLFYIEIGEEGGKNKIHINYSLKYTSLDRRGVIDDEAFLLFISSICFFFEIPKAYVYQEYRTNDVDVISKSDIEETAYYYNASYPLDIYLFLKTGKKRYEKVLDYELTPLFSYEAVKDLLFTKPITILDKEDSDELYQIYYQNYDTNKLGNTLGDFYVWVADNYCYQLNSLVNKLKRLYIFGNNPFDKLVYALDAYIFLYNRNKIFSIPDDKFQDYQLEISVKGNAEISKYREMVNKYQYMEYF